MKWIYYKQFSDFTSEHLYDVLKLRQDIFIIEQNCIYDDIDGLDEASSHLLLFDEHDLLIGYLRIVPAGNKFDKISLGRIAIRKQFRGKRLGKDLIKKGISLVLNSKSSEPGIIIEAQAHLEEYYQKLGFKTISDIYYVDDIPHLKMVLQVK